MAKARKDFIPRTNALFNPWQLNFVAKVNVYKTGWNFGTDATAEWAALTTTAATKKLAYDAAWAKVSSKQFDHKDEQKLKDTRKDYESGDRKNIADTSIRIFINRYIRFNPAVTNEQKIDIGIIVPDEVKSYGGGTTGSKGADLSGKTRKAEHLRHHNEVAITGVKSKALPDDVKSIQVFIAFTEAKVAAPPAISAYSYDGSVQRGKYIREFDTTLEGMRAWYYARMVFKGKKETYSPPSAVWSAVIM